MSPLCPNRSRHVLSLRAVTANTLRKKPLLPLGEGWDEGIKISLLPLFIPLTLTLSLGERESPAVNLMAAIEDRRGAKRQRRKCHSPETAKKSLMPSLHEI
ncbi:hypothetical protein U737_09560 [Methylomonas sp. LW13]|nr:hypothetical protein U737_09560 [Methylomonas sp. LW13]